MLVRMQTRNAHGLCLLLLLSVVMLLLTVVPASADLTAFLGPHDDAGEPNVKGLAIGTGLVIVGFEFEYAATDEDLTVRAVQPTRRRR